jgi:hypothetical protein
MIIFCYSSVNWVPGIFPSLEGKCWFAVLVISVYLREPKKQIVCINLCLLQIRETTRGCLHLCLHSQGAGHDSELRHYLLGRVCMPFD